MQGVLLLMIGALVLYLIWHPAFHLFSGINTNALKQPTPTTDKPSGLVRDNTVLGITDETPDDGLIYHPSLGGHINAHEM